MPQMAPISWIILFIIFTITFIMFNIFNYYSILPKAPYSTTEDNDNKIKSNSLNWKW